jgi:hypothetical protein
VRQVAVLPPSRDTDAEHQTRLQALTRALEQRGWTALPYRSGVALAAAGAAPGLLNIELLSAQIWDGFRTNEFEPPKIWPGFLTKELSPPQIWLGLLIAELGPPAICPSVRLTQPSRPTKSFELPKEPLPLTPSGKHFDNSRAVNGEATHPPQRSVGLSAWSEVTFTPNAVLLARGRAASFASSAEFEAGEGNRNSSGSL